jgi:hypothetical protein
MSAEDAMAIEVWNMVEQQGSVDWAGLPLVVGLLGITDIDGLVIRLRAIKAHARAPRKDR